MQIKPNIFVTYNGDFFDWPFIETRAHIHGINMFNEIGFSKSKDGVYFCRPAVHMDCLCWVKRDSYLPVGSQGLKAVAKAKLRYDPIELDPEEMCRMAKEQPQTLSNYSVSDAIATFYLYTKYVHPFIFALSTVVPMQPDEILRKGSGTLCETLLMVEAYKANIVYPNKQENEISKLTYDGHLIDTETYVGGHVEAVECGVYRADIPCRFRLDRNTLTELINNVDKVLEHAIVVEEGVPLEKVNNFSEIVDEIKQGLQGLYDIPNRVEQPVIYHLDVGAMYPNIILTNRLQPSAVVYDADCAVCDFNSPNAKCKRVMKWQWRGETLPATKNELERIRQQLKMEKFPPLQVGGKQRAFHELSQEDQVEYEKKRLLDYCRKVYKKTKVVKSEERISTICQKENSFYVDTVRAFRDRRYEYKGLTKLSKKSVSEAMKKGDASEIKAAKNKEILYDSLQLAHKCILNSFYGYVMRKGARWHSMPMAGIVCLTGSNIITEARNIIERIGRPLELDTDGIWCILPASFPQVVTGKSSYEGKSIFNISYPNAILNTMVKESFTNNQYHELVRMGDNVDKPVYQIRSENSIFFEVDGPYLAMVLPAAKEEGKKLKKRYAVFNFDGSLAELKGFEVKRRGELQLIKNFQSSVFESFLSGSTLEECYSNVAKIANYWLDVLYSHGHNLPDSELFDLISENRSMSKKLEDYGAQKSTSISTAKRLAEFLGDQMVKDAGLACKFVISKKPIGCPVTERVIPLAIFQCEATIRKCYLSRWLHDTTMGDADIRDVIDWNYYIERLSGAIQKIITIPAAMQGLNNPVPRVLHPDWLLKKILNTNDKLRQKQITDIFTVSKRSEKLNKREVPVNQFPEYNQMKRDCGMKRKQGELRDDLTEYIGQPPKIGHNKAEILNWLQYQKKKWAFQLDKRRGGRSNVKRMCPSNNLLQHNRNTVSEFLNRSRYLLHTHVWQVIQLTPLNDTGHFVVWAIVENDLHKIKLKIPRIFYINQRSRNASEEHLHRHRVWYYLPRGTQPYNIYQYKLDEQNFKCSGVSLVSGVAMTDIEGMYETKISLESRFLIEIGCLCRIKKNQSTPLSIAEEPRSNFYTFDQLKKCTDTNHYLNGSWENLKKLFLYQHSLGKRQIWGLFLPSSHCATIVILDTVRKDKMQNLNTLYATERVAYLKKIGAEDSLQPEYISFDIFMEIDIQQAYGHIQRCLSKYKDNKRGPTVLCSQTSIEYSKLRTVIPIIIEFPNITIHISDDVYKIQNLSWQIQTSRCMIRHFLNFNNVVNLMLKQSQYLNIPIGNLPPDPVLTGTDIFYARLLQKNNCILWWSPNNRPDLSGKETEDYKLLTGMNTNVRLSHNKPAFYMGICIALTVQNLAISALLHSDKIYDIMGDSTSTIFGKNVQTTFEDLLVSGDNMEIHSNGMGLYNGTFRILRSMVNGWLRELSLNKNVFSDYHIANFYRWIRTNKAFMYDPAICKALTILMEKILVGILIELKRLSVIIIFADVNRLIINTKKKNIIEAISYVEYIVQSIRKNELYHSVQLCFEQGWNNLVWLDPTNYGGIKVVVPSSENVIPNLDRILLNQTENIIDIHFSIGSQISNKNDFEIKFQEFATILIQSMLEGCLNESIHSISQKILGLTVDLHRKYGAEDSAAILRYIHAVMKILNITNDNEESIIALRRNLLKIVAANEYCKEDPFIGMEDFMYISATCKACNEFRDINLFVDEYRNVRHGK